MRKLPWVQRSKISFVDSNFYGASWRMLLQNRVLCKYRLIGVHCQIFWNVARMFCFIMGEYGGFYSTTEYEGNVTIWMQFIRERLLDYFLKEFFIIFLWKFLFLMRVRFWYFLFKWTQVLIFVKNLKCVRLMFQSIHFFFCNVIEYGR